MTATVDDFKEYFPELSDDSTEGDAAIARFLDEAALSNTLSACPKFADLIQLYYAAHEMAKSDYNPDGQNEDAGPVTSTSVGQVSQSNQVSSSANGGVSEDYYRSTSYGSKYLAFLKKCTGGAAVVAP